MDYFQAAGVSVLDVLEVKPHPCGQCSMATGADVCQREPHQATRTRSRNMGAGVCQREPCQATSSTNAAPRPFRPHMHKRSCRRLDSSGARSPNHRHANSCTWDPCPTVKEGCPRGATGGNRGAPCHLPQRQLATCGWGDCRGIGVGHARGQTTSLWAM